MKTATLVKLAPQPQTKSPQKRDKLSLSALENQPNIINPSRNITIDDENYLRDKELAADVISWDMGIYDTAVMVKPSDITNIAIAGDTVWYQLNSCQALPLNIEVFHSHRVQIQQHQSTWVPELTKTQNAPSGSSAKVKPQFATVATRDLQQLEATKRAEWKVVYDSLWEWYQVWVNDRCIGKESTYIKAEHKAQQYIAIDEFIKRKNAAVLMAYAG